MPSESTRLFRALALGALVLQSLPAAQSALPECESTVLTGRVYAPDGTPAAGAVVVSSAGGKAVTDARGTYRLEVDVPIDAELVELTAAAGSGGRSLVGRTLATASGARGTVPDTIVLASVSCCQPSWVPRFGGLPGVGGGEKAVDALAVFDDGDGPALYVAGTFTSAGGVSANGIAKWDGTSWSALGGGLRVAGLFDFAEVYALAEFDDGNGPALYAAGDFTQAGGVPANRIARWYQGSWSPLGSGMNQEIHSLAVFDDGNGPALYAGGLFTTAGGTASNHIARWNGASWAPLLGGLNGDVRALAVFDDGSGPALYAGGEFTGANSPKRIARWDGTSWSTLGIGMNNVVHALDTFDDGTGPVLVAGGLFTSAGGLAANQVARWDGASWSALGSGTNSEVRTLTVFDDGGGPSLYAGGGLVSRWDGTSWSSLGTAAGKLVSALAVFDDGGGSALHAGGNFTTLGGQQATRVARWHGSSWSPLVPIADSGLNDQVHVLAVFDDGSGPALYAGGYFTSVAGIASRIAKWNGTGWSPLGSGMNAVVNALAVFDDGGGPALYAGGVFNFSNEGGVIARIAKWNGSSWSAVGTGTNSSVSALTVFDDGSGSALYAGGTFTTAGGVAASRIAKWNGSSWSALGSGVGNGSIGTQPVRALMTFDDGSGPGLYAGGTFSTAGGVPAIGIARWNGTSWSALGSNQSSVAALTVFDDGSGLALYAAGGFSGHVARWNGATWSALGSGANNVVEALAVFDDGGGEALYAGGEFTAAGLVAANRIARWKGGSWSALGSGMNDSVFALAVHGDGVGASLYAGGSFASSTSHDSYVAAWGCFDVTPPVLFCPRGVIATDDLSPGEVVDFTVTAADSCDAAPAVVCVPPSGSFFPRGTTIVSCTTTDAVGNQSSCSFPVSVARLPRVR